MTVSSVAGADPPRASLVVTRDDGSRDCPDAAGIAERVRLMAGASVIEAATSEARDTWIQVELVRAFGGYRAVISARGRRQGTRSIDDVGPGCSSLTDAVAITLVMLLDPELEAAPPKPVVLPRPPALPVRPAPAPIAKPPRSTWTFGGEVAGGLAFSVLDGSAPFVDGGARLEVGRWLSFGAGGGYVFRDRARYGRGSVDLELAYGYVRGCGRLLSSPRARLELCVEPMLGSLGGAGNDYDTIFDHRVVWPAAAALAEVYGPLTANVFWSLRMLALAPLVYQQGFSVSIDGKRTLAFETPPAGGMLSVGVRADL